MSSDYTFPNTFARKFKRHCGIGKMTLRPFALSQALNHVVKAINARKPRQVTLPLVTLFSSSFEP